MLSFAISLSIGFVFLLLWAADVRKSWRFKSSFFSSQAVRFGVKAAIFIPLAVVYVNVIYPRAILAVNESKLLLFSTILSIGISIVWLRYLKWLDIYEPERNRFLALTFLLSTGFIWLVFPISAAIKESGFMLNGKAINDFLYCIITIGGVEEFVKILPVIFILKFTKQINEPIDYIIYGGVSALGFAFIENILYLNNTNLQAIGGRLLWASLAHMFFITCTTYPLALAYLGNGKRLNFMVLLGGFMLSSLAHGFYDFWLISSSTTMVWLTSVFFVLSLHAFTLMKNNLINLSNFYSVQVRINRSRLKYTLLWYILLVFYGGYILMAALSGSAAANTTLIQNALYHVGMVVYIAFTFGNLNFIPGYKLRWFSWFYNRRIAAYPDFSHKLITFAPTEKKASTQGSLIKRVVVGHDFNWYVFEDLVTKNHKLVRPLQFSWKLKNNSETLFSVAELENDFLPSKLLYQIGDLKEARKETATVA